MPLCHTAGSVTGQVEGAHSITPRNHGLPACRVPDAHQHYLILHRHQNSFLIPTLQMEKLRIRATQLHSCCSKSQDLNPGLALPLMLSPWPLNSGEGTTFARGAGRLSCRSLLIDPRLTMSCRFLYLSLTESLCFVPFLHYDRASIHPAPSQ